MPLYEYKCASCGKVFEVIQKFADEPLITHPECGGAVVRLLSAPAFHLKGTGWYATDYGKNAEKKAKPEKPDGKSDSEPKTGTPPPAATEAKPAASAEPKPSAPV